MRWSWKIGKVAGITVYVHATFLILLAWVGIEDYSKGKSLAAALQGVVFILTVFGAVVLHELSHALTARRFGIGTRDIILLPIGGVARMERIPDNPRQGLAVSLAGPAVNVVLALILYAVLSFAWGPEAATLDAVERGSFLARFLWVNVTLAVFNLLPAFPMDGGRVLKSILSLKMDSARATRIAATLGQMMAIFFGLFGLLYNPVLLFIAFFVWMGAAEESALAQMKSGMSGVPLAKLMITDFRTISPEETLARAVEHVLEGFQHDFPVVKDGRLVGMLTRVNLLKGLSQKGSGSSVGEVMTSDFPTAGPLESVEEAFSKLQNSNSPSLAVVDVGKVVGLLTLENLGEYLMMQSALHGGRV